MHACFLRHYYLFIPFSARSTFGRRRDERDPPFHAFIGSLTFLLFVRIEGITNGFISLLSVFFPSTRWSLILLDLSGLNANLWSGEPSSFSFFHKRDSYVAPASPVYFFFFLSGMNVLPSLEAIASPLSQGDRLWADNQRQPTSADPLPAASRGTTIELLFTHRQSKKHYRAWCTRPILSIRTAGTIVFRFPCFFP